jgi:surface carbohydrate biosynthesis protein
MRAAKAAGHIVLILEEETMATCTEFALSKFSSPDIYSLADYIFVHGDFEEEFHKNKYKFPSKVIKTGNPRIDILKNNFRFIHQNEISEINKKFDKFILINTNFQATNSFMGSKDDYINIAIRAGAIDPEDKESIQSYLDYILWEEECVLGIEKIVEKLSVLYSDRLKIIIRPHPGEILEKVIDKYKHLNNVEVLRIGSHIPWTLASEVLIHPTCTTGLEAAVANKCAVSFLPRSIWYSDQTISNQVNICIDNEQDVITYVQQKIENNLENSNKDLSNAKKFICNLSENNSINTIADFMENLSGLASYPSISQGDYRVIIRQPYQVEKCSIRSEEIIELLKLFLQNDLFFQKHPNKKFKIKEIDNSLFSLEFS